MRESLLMLGVFILGIFAGLFHILPEVMMENDFSTYALYALMFFVGVGIGMDEEARKAILQIRLKVIFIPALTILGTFIGVALVSVFMDAINLQEALAVGAGFGYYSLSTIFISELHGEVLGVVALISNIIREVGTIVLAPVLVRYFGALAAISAGGATSMDSSLPAITQAAGKDYAVISIFNGIVLSVAVPFLVTLIFGG